jgi:glycosyltransferase involved in cell wall biosynthesis
MKVAMVAFACQEYAVALTNALVPYCEMDFYTGGYELAKRDPTLLDALDSRVKAHRFGRFRVRDPRNLGVFSRLSQELRDGHYDVIHLQENAPLWMTPYWRTFLNVPVVATVHDPYQHSGLPFIRTIYQDMTQKICVRQAKKIIVHGQLLKRQVLERYRDKTDKDVVVLPHGDLSVTKRWEKGNPDHETGMDRSQNGGHAERSAEKRILYFGSARPNKGLRYLLEAESLLRNRLQNYKVVVAGDCGDFSRFDPYITPGAHLEVINHFISNEELPALFRGAAVVVLPYMSASQSGILTLAYTFGRPVVATRVGALPEVVVEGETGLLVEPGNPQALADAIVNILCSDERREEMGKSALKFCQEHMSWDAIARKTFDVYAELAGVPVQLLPV